ncbi:flagellar motor protein MotB [Chromobacterium sp. IIBBL 290-4]|uniref:flagellar motor protein MotB n=1 Tax=Chromobacterium sp. IIBBL 290-4 TaxID=2953890 RepID=UPI0020B89727|nr:flagellar motor protein MotB [Chromobacterium sp. IIBBL 290-4]UTH73157.1 OmpA family protein [Chromobacterium sp. IIBBL 290-4]
MSPLKNKNENEGAVIKRVSRRQTDEGHGGAWKVAFADFVLALMCLFLVLWVLAARDQENLQQMLSTSGGNPLLQGNGKQIDHQGNPPGSLIPREPIPGSTGSQAASRSVVRNSDKQGVDATAAARRSYDSEEDLRKLAADLAKMSEQAGLSSNLQTVITPYGLRITLHDTDQQGMFERGSAIVEPRFRTLLQQIGSMLGEIDNRLLLVGHTDAAQYHSAGFGALSNWSLSSSRAMAARMHMMQGGLAADSVLQVVGMAERAPLDSAHPLAAVNRRIELLVLTSGQAQAVVAMFGEPASGSAKLKGVASALPNAKELDLLRKNTIGIH